MRTENTKLDLMPGYSGSERDQRDHTYQIVFEENTEPKFIIDREGKIVDANKAFAELFSKKPEDCLGLNSYSLLPSQVAAELRKQADEAFSSGKRLVFEDERNGRFFRNSLYPVPGSSGRFDWLYVFAQDITDLKHSENKSRKQSAFSREAMEAIPGPFVVLDPRGSIITCNSLFRKIIARNEEDDLEGINSFALFHPDDKALAYEKLGNILQKGTEESAEVRIMIRGGPDFRWFRISTKKIVLGNEVFLVSAGTDISDHKTIEQQLSLSNEQLRYILAESGTGSWEWDLATGFCKWSDGIWELCGIEKNSCAPSYENWMKTIIEEDREKISREVCENLKKGLPLNLEWRILHPDRSIRWIYSKGMPFRNAAGSVSRYEGILVDITNLKQAELQLKESEERFRRLFEEHSSVMLIIDAETDRIINANTAASEFYGWPPDEICGMSIDKLSASSSDAIHKVREDIRQLREKKFPAVHRDADGFLHDVEVSCNLNEIAGKPVYYCIVDDVTDKKRTESELVKNKAILEAALESMSDAVFISDKEGQLIEFNNAFATFHRFRNKKECLRKFTEYPNILEVSMADGAPAPPEQWAVQRALRGETGVAIEYRLERRDTGEKWIGSYNFAPVRNHEGMITGSVVTGRDITNLKKAENALRESEELFRKLFEKHSAIMLLLDEATGDIIDVNDGASKYYGWSRKKMRTMNIRHLNINTERYVEKHLDATRNSGKLYFITSHRRADGSIRNVEVLAENFNLNDRAVVYAIIHDVTERVKAELQLKKLSFAIEQSPAVVVITDPDGNIEYVNPTFTKHTGYTFAEAKGQNPRILQSGLMPREFYEHLWNTILSGKVWHDEFHNKKKNGELYWEDAFISAIRNERGEITNFVAVKEDITEKKKLWNELVLSRNKAEESDRLKTSFLNNISHEIRTPMNGILGFSELLKEPMLTGEEQKEYIELIQQSGERMMKLINDIMEISRIDAKDAVVDLAETSLNSMLGKLYHDFSGIAESKALQLGWKAGLPNPESIIETDEAKLRLIMSNLLENALKFTHEGHVDFGYEKKDSLLEFYVVDTGVGVPSEMKEKIFERFSQLDISLSRFHEGAGLGLSITKAYIEMLGGIIHVEPGLTGGSRFFFTLPYTPARKPEPVQPAAAAETASLTIVIAEDDEVSALLLKKNLQNENCRLLLAHNGMETVELIRQHPETDLVLMDIKMPDMNGFDATRLIKEMRPDIPVIAQTAFASPEDREKAFYAGCDRFLTKPVKKSELLAMIKSLTGK